MNMTGASSGPKSQPRVGLFVTCLVDIIRPSVGFAAVKLLEDAGCKVVVPSQTCCGQPAYNAGDRESAKRLARQAIDAFQDCDYVVAPSGSCGGMLIKHYPDLFAGEPDLAQRAELFAGKTHELISFLVDVMGVKKVAARYEGTVAYHEFLRRPARTRGQDAAATASGRSRGPEAGRTERCGGLLRVWWIVRDQIW